MTAQSLKSTCQLIQLRAPVEIRLQVSKIQGRESVSWGAADQVNDISRDDYIDQVFIPLIHANNRIPSPSPVA
jgi:hypothetical protein